MQVQILYPSQFPEFEGNKENQKNKVWFLSMNSVDSAINVFGNRGYKLDGNFEMKKIIASIPTS